MDQEIGSAINKRFFHQKALAHIWKKNANRNARDTITADTQQNTTTAMALMYRDVIITEACTIDNGVIDIEENKSEQMLKIHAVPLVRYNGQGTEGLQRLRHHFAADNDGIAIATKVQWLANPCTIREMSQNR